MVDSNIWIYYTYPPACSMHSYHLNDYPEYLKKLASNGSELFYCPASISEIFHRIENTERKLFNLNIKPKEYRHNYPSEWKKVQEIRRTCLEMINSTATMLDMNITKSKFENVLDIVDNSVLDGYDAFILYCMQEYGIDKILTDDGDFTSVPNIEVFTSNKNVVSSAKKQQQLLCRKSKNKSRKNSSSSEPRKDLNE